MATKRRPCRARRILLAAGIPLVFAGLVCEPAADADASHLYLTSTAATFLPWLLERLGAQ